MTGDIMNASDCKYVIHVIKKWHFNNVVFRGKYFGHH